ncbi:ribosomal RNA small subunit methyltransferase E [Arenicella chitinivorans]|uniref:Ribosomal RNA small subunit methyltransferase E n=1 Tax=Arenicella chitinivorans TaxID=1329800 RepID=A0A918RK16_9GAMM|nr:RsmE family RNA methyltransferase [Arenicella chitinivorans]GHA00074.1 ribosomal RNA small subunit methyltransferase E [Arenicella chitinivorans]
MSVSLPTFFHAELNVADALLELSPQESQHAAKARRLRAGSQVRVLNGRGLIADAQIITVERSKVTLKIVSAQEFEPPRYRLCVATAVPKGDRQKVMLDMMCQLGVTQILPLECEHSVTHFSRNMYDKWLRATIEACKQSQNPWLPEILPAQSSVSLTPSESHSLFYADGDGQLLMDAVDASCEEMTIVIGPEGGFSAPELAHFQTAGMQSIRLGDHILRTEAASIAAVSQWGQIRMKFEC